MNENYSLKDAHRILLGTEPGTYLLEVLVRTALVYLALWVVVRLLGKRMSGQVSILEMGVMLVLGAIVSGPMQTAEQGILPALLLLVALLVLQRSLSAAAARSAKLEQLLFGDITILAKDGELALDAMERARVSREQLFAVLRGHGVRQLNQVARVYLEASGAFSVLQEPGGDSNFGLLPPFDRSDGDSHASGH